MVETALRPRPSFYTFLQADSYRSGDALTYYDYQRAIRSKKVEILQQKRSLSYEPGYKKPGVPHPAIGSTSRKVFQLKSRYPINTPCTVAIEPASSVKTKEAPMESANEQINKSPPHESVNPSDSTASLDGLEPSASKTSLSASRPSSAKANSDKDKENMNDPTTAVSVTGQAQTERLPRIVRKPRLVKSATAREHKVQLSSSSVTSPPPLPQRPKTVASTRESGVQTTDSRERFANGLPLEGKPLISNMQHQRAYSEGLQQIKQENGLTGQDELCRSYQWGTTTQRSYNEVRWAEKVPVPRAFLPTTTVEQFPDPVSQRLTFRRYNSEPAGWQTFGSEWDYVQTRRCDNFIKGPQAVAFCSGSKKTQHIPGYAGYLPELGVFEEDINASYTPVNLVRTTKPRKSSISRRANIPGYSGQVHWASASPAHSNMPIPEYTTSARTYRMIPLEDEPSPFRRDGVFSKMVTTVSPYNPFNKIEY